MSAPAFHVDENFATRLRGNGWFEFPIREPNNLVEQDHRNIKRRIKLMTGFKSFRRARTILAGIELHHMIRKGQYKHQGGDGLSPAEQFYLLAV